MPAGGALGYLTVEPPRALSYGPPAVDSSWLSQLPQEYRQGQQYARERQLQTMFQPGTPGAAVLAQSGITPDSLLGVLARAQGAQALQGLMLPLMGSQAAQNLQQRVPSTDVMGGQGAQPTSGQAQGGDALFNSIYQQESSSGRNTATSWAGARGPMQIKPETFNAFAQPGENINNSDDNIAVGKRILNHYVEKYGDPARAAVAYYSGEGNVAPAGSPTPWKVNRQPINPRTGRPEPSVSQYVVSVLGRMRSGTQVAAATPAPGTASDQLNPADRAAVDQIYSASALAAPPGAATPTPSQNVADRFPEGEESEGAGGPATGAPAPVSAAQPTGSFGTNPYTSKPANIQLASTSPDIPGRGGIPPAPAPSSPISPAGNTVVAQGPAQTTGQLPVTAPEANPEVRRYDQAIAARQRAAEEAAASPYEPVRALGKTYENAVKTLQEQRQKVVDRLTKQQEMQQQTREEGARVRQAGDIKYYDDQYANIQKQGDEADNRIQTLRLAKSLMDNPDFASGAGAQFQLQMRQIAARLPGFDPNIATSQEAYKKVVSEAMLEQIRSLGGQGLGQVRQSEIGVIKDLSQSLDVSVATNRLRTELATRMLEKWTVPLAEMARQYKADHGGLDVGWDKQRAAYMNKTPLLTEAELKDTRRIAPPLARGPADLARIGWREGMPFRDTEGNIYTHSKKPVDVSVRPGGQ